MHFELLAVTAEIQSDIEAIEENLALYEETNFNSRTDAVDFIDFHIIDRLDGLLENTPSSENLSSLKIRAEEVKHTLETININLFKQLRKNIAAGRYKNAYFTEMIGGYFGAQVIDTDDLNKIGYDNLDVFINGLLNDGGDAATTVDLEPEMVFYQKTPARVVFEMATKGNFSQDDVFVDLGSGPGQVAILVNLISGIATRGIEFEPAYCTLAQACASQLNLQNVEFVNTDARQADYSIGTVFFMYTPFKGGILQEVLQLLQKKSTQRTIRIFTYGPCSPQVAQQDWLCCTNGKGDDFYKLYEFVS
ncbi:hypothetical protein HDF24_17740 [Mucilaginibacter sp. X4EP1]|uniref:class I SAM-dependent methyltransferase n=1 Tax=Mucilaginibacter sp. X4EP1 TaxID=2723092 RepID=UPI0021673963|nr:class I SAM-dependent methyltransferase [Mucilaginibacter sp. X4EP1]